MESPYDVLRIDSDADEEEIERAYRCRVLESHPDHGGSAAEFQRVRAAYSEITSNDADDREPSQPRPDRERAEEQPDTPIARVEYLDYEALADHGWSLDDEDLFEKASGAGLPPDDHGRIAVEPRETLLQAAEGRGFSWPFACRGGACANCAVAVIDGDLSLPVNHILPGEMVDAGIRLSCVGAPTTDVARVVYNVKHLPELDDLRLPPRPFTQARYGD